MAKKNNETIEDTNPEPTENESAVDLPKDEPNELEKTIQEALDSLDVEAKGIFLSFCKDVNSNTDRSVASKISGIADYALGLAKTPDVAKKMGIVNANLDSPKAITFYQNLINTLNAPMAVETKLSLIAQGLDDLTR